MSEQSHARDSDPYPSPWDAKCANLETELGHYKSDYQDMKAEIERLAAECDTLREALDDTHSKRIEAAVEGSEWKLRALAAEAERDAALATINRASIDMQVLNEMHNDSLNKLATTRRDVYAECAAVCEKIEPSDGWGIEVAAGWNEGFRQAKHECAEAIKQAGENQ